MKRITAIPKLLSRKKDAHKGDFGKVCIVAGSIGMTGAAAIAGRSTLRSGAGLVRVATAKSALPIIAAIEPCFTSIPLDEDGAGRIAGKAIGKILKIIPENDVIAFGPGLGVSSGLQDILRTLLARDDLRFVIDADGLNNLTKIKDFHAVRKADLILTPHPGEMARLWKSIFRDPMPEDRAKTASQFAQKTGAVIVLKGAGTVVTDGQKLYVNKTGNPGMATAGSGDVLTGVIAALAGQGLNSFDAAVLGVYIHGLAGDIAAKVLGQVAMIATDIAEALPKAFLQYQKKERK